MEERGGRKEGRERHRRTMKEKEPKEKERKGRQNEEVRVISKKEEEVK